MASFSCKLPHTCSHEHHPFVPICLTRPFNNKRVPPTSEIHIGWWEANKRGGVLGPLNQKRIIWRQRQKQAGRHKRGGSGKLKHLKLSHCGCMMMAMHSQQAVPASRPAAGFTMEAWQIPNPRQQVMISKTATCICKCDQRWETAVTYHNGFAANHANYCLSGGDRLLFQKLKSCHDQVPHVLQIACVMKAQLLLAPSTCIVLLALASGLL